jgi:hypothetical protein
MVGNLISNTSVLANICATQGVHVSEIKAVDNEGNPVWKEKWTKEEAREYADFVGYRAWNKEMMHNPIVEGTVFRQEWIRWAKRPAWKEFTEFVLYIDPSWKSKKTNDTKAAKLWGKHKTNLWHLRAFVRKASVAEMVRWCYDLYEWSRELASPYASRWRPHQQDIILDDFTIEGNIGETSCPSRVTTRKKPDKFQRVEAISPLWERGYRLLRPLTEGRSGHARQEWRRRSPLRRECRAMTTRLMPTIGSHLHPPEEHTTADLQTEVRAPSRPLKTYGDMFKLIKDIVLAVRFKREPSASQQTVGFVQNEVLCAQYGWQTQGCAQTEHPPVHPSAQVQERHQAGRHRASCALRATSYQTYRTYRP